jgi:hypothetical protein
MSNLVSYFLKVLFALRRCLINLLLVLSIIDQILKVSNVGLRRTLFVSGSAFFVTVWT